MYFCLLVRVLLWTTWKLVFEIFDVDRQGIITMAELDAMLRMLHGSTEADPDLLRILAVNGSNDEDALTFDEFLKVYGRFLGQLPGFG